MTKTSANISVIIILLIFRSTFASDADFLFPKEFPEERLVKCGLKHDLFGISILNGYLYQLGRCSLVIYPPPLDQYLDENLEHIKFDNGYRYNYSEIIPTTKADICMMASPEVDDDHGPILLLNHMKMPNDGRNQHNKKQREQHDNHYILYFVGKINGVWAYCTYDFNTITYQDIKIFSEGSEYHHIMLTNGDEVKHIVNEMLKLDGYGLRGDSLTNNEGVVHGYMCMRQADDGINYIIKLKLFHYDCEKSQLKIAESFVKKISFTITAHNKVIFISKIEQRMYITNITFVQWTHRTEEFYLEVKPLKDFFVCSKSPSKITHEPIVVIKTTTTIEPFESKMKRNMHIIIPVIIVLVLICILIAAIICSDNPENTIQTNHSIRQVSTKVTEKKEKFNNNTIKPKSSNNSIPKTTNNITAAAAAAVKPTINHYHRWKQKRKINSIKQLDLY
ncbi:hypothetical protein DERP_003065 [Dermatophagoides pteronyssinus]|uniref:Uncharacterized protein n=1 Tax=Dermatophagoides pteronyssinus TaxID=6956 RepID=A0ABQ8JIF2_DERPT|nr:hypothetical protein DERP_003065 [Dermatophagoides pteronyssinus]